MLNKLKFDLDDSDFEFSYVKKQTLTDDEMFLFLERMIFNLELNKDELYDFYLLLINPDFSGFAKEWEVFLRKNGYIK